MMRRCFRFFCALTLLPGVVWGQGALTDTLADPTVRAQVTDRIKAVLQEDAGYTAQVRPELFRIGFESADCLEFYDEMGDVTVGTCLLNASGWQMYAVFALTFGYLDDGGPVVHPLTIVIE